MYLIKIPWVVRKYYSDYLWKVDTKEKIIYLTFDDGPHEVATPFVLDELKKYNAKGTFFCIGKNVVDHPSIFERLKNEGHRIGNHTYQHLNGSTVKDDEYIHDIFNAKKVIDSDIFRPPYGKISKFQFRLMNEANLNLKVVMWDLLSGDFDLNLTGEKCFMNVIDNCSKGSIVVFHDSSKAFSRLEYALPRTMEYFSNKGFEFKSLP
ncbi:MAG: polysaccharide deacetylase family protein [Ginsengibacter sp.]